MAKMWAGRTAGSTAGIADDFNSSIHFDKRMYRQDIEGSIAHASMLARQGIIGMEDAELLIQGLKDILADLDSGRLEFDFSCEDIHMFVEQVLTERIGDTGKMLHTARSRNDQVALDLRMYLRDEVNDLKALTSGLITVLVRTAEKYPSAVMPGYTHLQRAQPILFSHHILAYVMMLLRDFDRMTDAARRINVSPIGSCALAGTTYDTDRRYEAELLGFESIALNSIDGVSDRDFCVELMSDIAILMMHLSRLSEELVLWSSWEFKFIELSDGFTTGSSIMPQKKNPDMAELIRGKTGRVYGDLMALLTTLKGLPLAYNKDMQEDKEAVFDSVDTVRMCLKVMTPMIESMSILPDNMRKAANEGFINATDLADYLVRKGMPFRTAYKISGSIVSECIARGLVLDTYPMEDYKKHSGLFEDDVYAEINIDNCVNKRISAGGTSSASVAEELRLVREEMRNRGIISG